MAVNGKGNLDDFVDGLFDTDVPPRDQNRVVPGGAHPNMGMQAHPGVIPMQGGQIPMNMPGMGGQGLAGFQSAPMRGPMVAPRVATGGAAMTVQGGGANGPTMSRVPGPGVVPANLLSGVPSTGFAAATGPSRAPTTGGLSGLHAQLPQHHIKLQSNVAGTPTARVLSNATTAYAAPHHAQGNIAVQSTIPPGGASMPQAVSNKAATAAMAKSAATTSGPAVKKQILSETGASRSRNADGTLKADVDEEDEELITKDEEDPGFEPSVYGKSRITEEEERKELGKDEARKLVNARVIKVKVDSLCAKEGVRANPKVAEAIALGLTRRLREALEVMVQNSRRRMDVEGDTAKASIVRSSNPRLYLKEEERKRQEIREKRIADKLAAESGQAALDPSALRRQEEEAAEMALSFAGGARRRPNALAAQLAAQAKDNPATDGLSNQPGQGAGGASGVNIKDRHRRVTLHDALNFLRQDLHSKHSQLTLNTMAGLRIPEAFSSPSGQSAAPAHHTAAPHISTRSSAYSASAMGPTTTTTLGMVVSQPRPVPTNSLPPTTTLSTRSSSRPSNAPTVGSAKK